MSKVVVGLVSCISPEGEPTWLLVSAAKDWGEYTGFYYPPGGHIESGESEAEALVREIKEELSLEAVPIERIAETPGDVPGQATYWWRCKVSGDLKLDEELSDAQYFTRQQIEHEINVWPATRKFFAEHVFN